MKPASTERWTEAQTAEREYWNWPTVDSRELLRIALGLSEAATWAQRYLPSHPPEVDWLEIGIGPLGMGCMHFFSGLGSRKLVGVDPLPLIDLRDIRLPSPVAATVAACRAENYEHVVSPGEATPLNDDRFGLVLAHNVLDHVRDPAAVVRECYRVLQPGGWLFVACDTSSRVGRLTFELFTKRRRADTWLVRAHPFQFRAPDVISLVEQARFRIVAQDSPGAAVQRLAGRSRRLFLVARKSP